MEESIVAVQEKPDQYAALYATLQEERRSDLARHRQALLDVDRLRRQVADQMDLVRKAEAGLLALEKPEPLTNVLLRIDAEASVGGNSLLKRFLAAGLLRLARQAARTSHWGQAQIYYQAIILLRPRAHIWKQTGNMLYQQGLHEQARGVLKHALKMMPGDPETQFLLDRCNEALEEA